MVISNNVKILDTETGAYVSPEELLGDTDFKAAVLNQDFVIIKSKNSPLIKRKGEKELFQVIVKTGRSIECTKETALFTPLGWKQLKDIQPGESIAVPNKLDFWNDYQVSDTDAKILAYMIGDGSYTGYRTRFTKEPNSKQVEELSQLVKVYNCELHHYDSSNRCNFDIRKMYNLHDPTYPNGIRNMLIEYNIYDHTAASKFVPLEIFMASKKTVAIFLSRLFATDGWASIASGPNQAAQIGYSSISVELIRGIAHLLLRFGINCHVRRAKDGCYSLSVTSKKDILLFCSQIGIYGKEDAVDKVKAFILQRTEKAALLPIEFNARIGEELRRQEITIAEMEYVLKDAGCPQKLNLKKHRIQKNRSAIIAECLQMEKLSKIIAGDIDWLEVKNIASIGKHQAFEIEGAHNIIVNDMLISNHK